MAIYYRWRSPGVSGRGVQRAKPAAIHTRILLSVFFLHETVPGVRSFLSNHYIGVSSYIMSFVSVVSILSHLALCWSARKSHCQLLVQSIWCSTRLRLDNHRNFFKPDTIDCFVDNMIVCGIPVHESTKARTPQHTMLEPCVVGRWAELPWWTINWVAWHCFINY